MTPAEWRLLMFRRLAVIGLVALALAPENSCATSLRYSALIGS